MPLWQEQLYGIDAILENPETLDCVKPVNSVVECNWKNFIDNPLQCHILKYLVEVDFKGQVSLSSARPGPSVFVMDLGF